MTAINWVKHSVMPHPLSRWNSSKEQLWNQV